MIASPRSNRIYSPRQQDDRKFSEIELQILRAKQKLDDLQLENKFISQVIGAQLKDQLTKSIEENYQSSIRNHRDFRALKYFLNDNQNLFEAKENPCSQDQINDLKDFDIDVLDLDLIQQLQDQYEITEADIELINNVQDIKSVFFGKKKADVINYLTSMNQLKQDYEEEQERLRIEAEQEEKERIKREERAKRKSWRNMRSPARSKSRSTTRRIDYNKVRSVVAQKFAVLPKGQPKKKSRSPRRSTRDQDKYESHIQEMVDSHDLRVFVNDTIEKRLKIRKSMSREKVPKKSQSKHGSFMKENRDERFLRSVIDTQDKKKEYYTRIYGEQAPVMAENYYDDGFEFSEKKDDWNPYFGSKK